uniref:Protein ENHANCED DISEASE RESISTANCE 2 C-terminal domain-containing protein n=1 Tax=Lotharella globosa TaxID=91324 RepID=A0A7S3YV23_9EUKA
MFYIVGFLTVLTSLLLRTMSTMSCLLTFVLVSVPLYGIIVAGIPFSIDLVLSFDHAQQWPPALIDKQRSTGTSRRQRAAQSALRESMPDYSPFSPKDGIDGKHDDSAENKAEVYPPQKVVPGWSNLPASLFAKLEAQDFQVRCGPDYSRHKKKAASAPAFYDFREADIFCCQGAGACIHIAEHVDLSKYVPDQKEGWVNGAPRVIVSCLQFSVDDDNAGWFGKPEKSRTRTYGFLMFFTLNETGVKAMAENTPQANLFRRFCREEVEYTRFKTIIKIRDKDKLGLPFMLRKSMDQLDGKPFLAGKPKDGKAFRFIGDCYMEFDTLTQNYSYLARKGIGTCKGKLILLKFHYGFAVEAQKDEEMPEQILGCLQLGPGIDYLKMAAETNWTLIKKF